MIALAGRLLDGASRALFALACAALALAGGLTAYEVGARYLLGAPTTWSGEAVSLCLAVVIFGALPQVTREGGHVAIDLLPERLSPGAGRRLSRAEAVLAALATGAAALVAGSEALSQMELGVRFGTAHPIPRWWLTGLVAAGLALAALQIARTARGRR